MEADDAADLLGEFSAARQAELLGAMDPDEAEPVRRLLSYEPDTAGGLMTPEPIILGPQATVAEALARIRDPDLPVPLAAQVFVCQPPLETPTGRFLGVVGVQRLLREAPSKPVGRCLDEDWEPIEADASDREVAERLAAYDVVALPVTDAARRLRRRRDHRRRARPRTARRLARRARELADGPPRRSRQAPRHSRRAVLRPRRLRAATPSAWRASSGPAATWRPRRSS